MEPLIIASKTNTKLKSTLWGLFFILFGLALEVGMIRLIVTEGFSIVYILGILLFTLIIWAGFASLNLRKYPLELLADDKGIHYYIYDSKFGYGKHEVVISWETVVAITQYADEELDPEDCEDAALVVQSLGELGNPTVIWLGDTEITSDNIADIVSKLNELWEFYSNLDERTQPNGV